MQDRDRAGLRKQKDTQFIELDAIHWGPNWAMPAEEDFRERVARALEGEAWVADGNYGKARDITWGCAQALVWLDYRLSVCLVRLLVRTVQRIATRERLWNDNHETLRGKLAPDGLIPYTIRKYRGRRIRYAALLQEPAYAHLPVFRLRSPREARRWLETIATNKGGHMSTDELLLRDFQPRTALVTEDHTPQRARCPVIDIHNHLRHPSLDASTLVALMDELNIQSMIDLDGGWGDQLQGHLERFKHPYPDRFCVFAWVDWSQLDEPGFGETWAARLADAVGAGAQGLKVFKRLGLSYRDSSGALVLPDDPRLDPVWAAAGELGIPVLIHSADPVAFFWPLDETNERWEELQAHPGWHFYGDEYPSHIELIESQLRLVERHSGTTFVSAHVLSYSEHLRYVAQALDRYPNLYVDISARIGELGRQPYTARWFLTEYADRVLFGTDITPNAATYQIYFRCLETADEHFDYGSNQGRYRIYGLHLPDEVLSKVYHGNACRVVPGLNCAE